MSRLFLSLLPVLCCLVLAAQPSFAAAAANSEKAGVATVNAVEKTDGKQKGQTGQTQQATSATAGKKAAASGEREREQGDSQAAQPAPVQETNAQAADEEDKDPWEEIWQLQRGSLQHVEKTAAEASNNFRELSETLAAQTDKYQDRATELLRQANASLKWNNGLEAARRKIGTTIREIRDLLTPFTQRRQQLLTMLDEMGFSNSLIVDESLLQKQGEEADRARAVPLARMRLMAALTQCFTTTAPTMATVQRLEKAQRDITAALPKIWKDYYLQERLEWYSAAAWAQYANFDQLLLAMKVRLPVEIPIKADEWQAMGKRMLIALLLCGSLLFLLHKRFLGVRKDPVLRHIFHVCLPVLACGGALCYASLEYSGAIYRLVMAVGNLFLILAQVLLAWDLRRHARHDEVPQKSPLLFLLPPTFLAYILLYLPLMPTTRFALWLLCLVAIMVLRSYRTQLPINGMHVENSTLETEGIVLWICLILTLAGLHRYSMLVYMIFVSISLSLQLSLGGIAHISRANEHLPNEGVRAVLASLVVALAAPLVLVVAVASVLLWIATLPGGIWIVSEYILNSFSIGSTRFDLWQILFLISLFFLTRAAVILVSRFLAQLPERVNFDSTFIPPIQTALTYAMWAFFGMFVLRSLGIELSNLAMVAGGLSVGIGLGLQGIVSNFFSGLILIFGRMLQAGDVIEVGGVTGRVRKISVRDTLVETYDNAMIYVPNSEFIAGRLTNWTRNNPIVRGKIMVGVAYGSDTALVKKLLQKIAAEHEAVLKYPAPSVVFSDFGPSSLDFTLRFWVKNYDASLGAASDIRMEIDRLFAQHHIEIAFPQMDVHVKELPPRAKKRLPQAGHRRPRIQRLPKFRQVATKPATGTADESMEALREQSTD